MTYTTKEEIEDWVLHKRLDTAVTLTTAYAVKDRDIIEKIYGEFLHRMSRHVLGNRHRKFNEQLKNIATYEWNIDANDGKPKWHIHSIIDRTDNYDLDRFRDTVNTVWRKMMGTHKVQTKVKDVYSDGWGEYITKFITNTSTLSNVSSYSIL